MLCVRVSYTVLMFSFQHKTCPADLENVLDRLQKNQNRQNIKTDLAGYKVALPLLQLSLSVFISCKTLPDVPKSLELSEFARIDWAHCMTLLSKRGVRHKRNLVR